MLRRKRLRHEGLERAEGFTGQQLTPEAAAACAGQAVGALHAAPPGSRKCVEAARDVRRLLCRGAPSPPAT